MKTLKGLLLGLGTVGMALSACMGKQPALTASGLDAARFDTVIQERPVHLYTLHNGQGTEVCITNYGARVVSLCVPDRDGRLVDVVLGYDNISQYADTIGSPSDFGASVGRYANRIHEGRFTLGGQTYQLTQNDTGNGAHHCLHGGGNTGWMHRVYDVVEQSDSMLKLVIVSLDGDNGFPGTVTATTTYRLTADNAFDITWEAETDRETIINQTNHNYYNLSGDPSTKGLDMVLYVNADAFTPSDASYMTTGEVLPVEGTPMDFRHPHAIGDSIRSDYQQIRNATGYDHNFCLNTYRDGRGDDTTVCASLYSPRTGIFMEMFTNEPGLQVYTGNFQGTGISCKHGIRYPKHVSVCLESQKYPDSPNKPQWVQPTLKPSEKYQSHTAYKFSVK